MILLSAAWLSATWRGDSVFADSAGGKPVTLLVGSCSPASPSSYYLLRVPGISSLKQGHCQESHTYLLCFITEFSSVEGVGVLGFFFFSLQAMAWLTPVKTSLLCSEGGEECALQYYFVCMEAFSIRRTIQLN